MGYLLFIFIDYTTDSNNLTSSMCITVPITIYAIIMSRDQRKSRDQRPTPPKRDITFLAGKWIIKMCIAIELSIVIYSIWVTL